MTLSVGVMPKSTRNPCLEDCRRGAEEAAKELGFTLQWDGPAEPDVDQQAQIVARWARDGLSAIAFSVEDPARGNVMIRGDEIRLGRCHIVSQGNLERFD
jgi:ABC-type sugar transport system substrate-binding protein